MNSPVAMDVIFVEIDCFTSGCVYVLRLQRAHDRQAGFVFEVTLVRCPLVYYYPLSRAFYMCIHSSLQHPHRLVVLVVLRPSRATYLFT